jgi:hypothetical protein
MNSLAKSGMASTGAEVTAALRAANAVAVASSHTKASFLSKPVSGAAIVP